MIQLAAEITAWFADIDEAELAARQLRQRGHGISSLKIRQPRPKGNDNGVPHPTALSFYGTTAGQSWMSGGNMATTPVLFPALMADNDGAIGGQDGPAGRSDCLMVIRTGERHAQHNAAILTSLHAQNLHVVTGLP